MLTEKEIHQLAMNVVGEALEADGFEFLAVNSKPKKDPQFVCLKDKKLHFIAVKGSCYPTNPKRYDKQWMDRIKTHAQKYEAKTYYAGVGFAHAKDYHLPLDKNAPYVINYEGLQEII
ncbi:MAG: Na(+)-translocating NADH-quinone reductase subunit F [Flavobacteriaceae bacterium]|jgi:transcription initiation factor TFIID subunit TAF12|nr:Na(+)-translocating NADH-quinone reductase subunit F [Flavobacteriia bacterium]